MDIHAVFANLHASGLSYSISSSPDYGWKVRLGVELNRFADEGTFATLEECAEFLNATALRRYPESDYAKKAFENSSRDN